MGVIRASAVLLATLIIGVGCDSSSNKTAGSHGSNSGTAETTGTQLEPSAKSREVDLNDLWKLNQYVWGKIGRSARSVEEMEPYVKNLHPKNGFSRIKSGEIVFSWTDDFLDAKPLDERTKLIIAWDKAPDKNGRVSVLYADSMTATVPVAEFDRLPKLKPLK